MQSSAYCAQRETGDVLITTAAPFGAIIERNWSSVMPDCRMSASTAFWLPDMTAMSKSTFKSSCGEVGIETGGEVGGEMGGENAFGENTVMGACASGGGGIIRRLMLCGWLFTVTEDIVTGPCCEAM